MSKKTPCMHCGGETPEYHNYCSWDCMVKAAKAAGGKIHTPNGLPIMCITADNTMLEVAHGDHPDYKFPVTAKYLLEREDEYDSPDEVHALIYTDGSIALTLYECCYALWHLRDGTIISGGSLWKEGEWQLDDESLDKILHIKA